MQAITTKFMSPTNVKGSRIKATCQAGSLTLHWDHALNPDQNHCRAAKALAVKLGWTYGTWQSGELPDGSSVWVCPDKHARDGRESFTLNNTIAA